MYSTSSLFRHIFPFSRPFSIPKLSRPLIFVRPRKIYTASPQKSIFVFVVLIVCFAALKAATKGSPWMGPSFTWMDQDPRGPWTRCPTRCGMPVPIAGDRPWEAGLRKPNGRSMGFNSNMTKMNYRSPSAPCNCFFPLFAV